MTDFVTSRDGTRIAYEVAGRGPALILVDGAFCYREFGPMRELAKMLANDFRVLLYDRRARGESGPGPIGEGRTYDTQREIEDLDALFGAVGGQAHLYGISSGAALALAAAAAGLPVRKLALYEPPYQVGPHARVLPADRKAVLESMIAADRRSDAAKYFMCDIIGMPRFMGFVFQFLPMWKKLKGVAPSLPFDLAVMGDFKVPTERAAAVRVPTLVMHGGKTWPALRDAAPATATAIPVARHFELPGQTHNVAARALTPILKEFFLEGTR